MTAPEKPGAQPATINAAPAATSSPAFELTADEMILAVRFFSACRRMSGKARRNCLIFADMAEEMAIKYPLRPSARLRLVSGGAS